MAVNIRAMLLASVGATGLMASSAAAAQTVGVPNSDATAVSELVVTAEKREERLLDVPLPVQAVSAAAIENSGATKISDLVSAIPSAAIVSSTTPGFETIEIRGIASGTTGDSLVGYYVDDTPFNIPNLQLTPPAQLLDLERVEVIRGPSATLYGQGAMGGTIKLITAKPDPNHFSGKFQGEISGTEGGGTNYDLNGVVNLPLVADRLAARLAVGYQHLSGYADAPENHETDANDFTGKNARLTLGWTPTNDISITAFAWMIRNRQNYSNSLTPQNATTASLVPTQFTEPAIVGTNGRPDYTNVNADIYSLTGNWATSIGDLTANASYIQHKLFFNDPLLTILDNLSTFKTWSYTGEIRLASKADSPVKWLIGAYDRDSRIRSDIFYYEQLTLTGPKIPIINTLGDLTTKSYSIFGEISYPLFDGKLTPLLGLEFFHDDRGTNGVDRNTGLPRTGSASYSSTNPRFNLEYKPASNGNIYFNAAKGFRSGALQTPAQATAANTTLGLPPGTISTTIQPDSLWTYEIGTRWELADRTVLLEGSVYHTDWKNVLVQFATSAVISLANGGDAKIDGVEAGARWRTPMDGLVLSANGSVNNAKFKSVVGALATGTAIRVGGPVPNTPRTTFTVSADYSRELPWWNGVTGAAYAAYAYRSKVYDATTKGLASGDVKDLTLRAGIKKDDWKIDLFADNALNSHEPMVISSTALQILYPRRIGVELGYSF
jgi:outer membrane receptor protein involved in Fe transport